VRWHGVLVPVIYMIIGLPAVGVRFPSYITIKKRCSYTDTSGFWCGLDDIAFWVVILGWY